MSNCARPQNAATSLTTGQALALSTKDWALRLKFVLEQHSAKLHVLLILAGMLALRVGEACKLKRGDFRLSFDIPVLNVSGGRSPGIVPIQPEERAKLSKFMKAGVKSERSIKNQYGSTIIPGLYVSPSKGILFPSPRNDSDLFGVRGVTKAVKIQSGQFDKKYSCNDFQRIRSHSGRAICFALMMGEGVPFPLSMKFARHAQGSLKIHLGYGRLTVVDIHKYLVERRYSQIPGRNLEVVPAEKTKRKTGSKIAV